MSHEYLNRRAVGNVKLVLGKVKTSHVVNVHDALWDANKGIGSEIIPLLTVLLLRPTDDIFTLVFEKAHTAGKANVRLAKDVLSEVSDDFTRRKLYDEDNIIQQLNFLVDDFGGIRAWLEEGDEIERTGSYEVEAHPLPTAAELYGKNT